jgi:hypothetical protein
VILQLKPERLIQYTHFSPLSGKADLPENYHKVTIELLSKGSETTILLFQDNNEDEESKEHSEQNWKMMLDELKKLLENRLPKLKHMTSHKDI